MSYDAALTLFARTRGDDAGEVIPHLVRDGHLERAGASVGAFPGQARTDDPLPKRDHFLEFDTVAVLARWRAHRAAFAAAPTRRGHVAAARVA
jgi:hypothetical protein